MTFFDYYHLEATRASGDGDGDGVDFILGGQIALLEEDVSGPSGCYSSIELLVPAQPGGYLQVFVVDNWHVIVVPTISLACLENLRKVP